MTTEQEQVIVRGLISEIGAARSAEDILAIARAIQNTRNLAAAARRLSMPEVGVPQIYVPAPPAMPSQMPDAPPPSVRYPPPPPMRRQVGESISMNFDALSEDQGLPEEF